MQTNVPPRKGKKGTGSKVPPRGTNPSAPSKRPGAAKQGKQAAFQARRRQQRLLVLTAIAVVVVVVAVFIVVKAAGGGSSKGNTTATAASSSVVNEITGITASDMLAGLKGGQLQGYPQAINAPLSSGGKPEVLYMGAEYCPYCAGERWALVAALSKFGTFTNLGHVTSESDDTVASVPTFTFYGSTFSSPYLTFTPVELDTVSGKVLQNPTAQQSALIGKYDAPPYSDEKGGIPFIDIGGKWIQDGINWDDSGLAHANFETVAQDVSSQTGQQAADILATAGVLTSTFCQLTGGKSLVPGTCAAFPHAITSAASAA